MVTDEDAIATVLVSYQDALSRSDADAVTKLFTTDGVLMAQESPSAVGAEAVRQAYGAMFGGIALDIRFEIAEIRPLASEWAFARTTSTGRIEVKGDWRAPARGQSGTLHLPEGRWDLEDRALLLLYHPLGARMTLSARTRTMNMKAAVIYEPGAAEVLKIESRPIHRRRRERC